MDNNSNPAVPLTEIIVPVTLTEAETILHLVCLSQGVPINLLIGIVILRNRRLHNPRNTFWLGIIFLNLLTMIMAVLKLLAVYKADPDDKNNYICLSFSITTGIPYTILLFMMLLATLDRYVAITYPLYHRKHVTVRLVIFVQIGCFIFFLFLLSMPFIFGWIPLRCGFNLTLGKWTMLLRSILVTLCITAQVKVYLNTRRYLRQTEVQPILIPLQKTIVSHRESSIPASSAADLIDRESCEFMVESEQNKSVSILSANKNAPFFVHRRNKTVSKLELEASLTLVVGVLFLCIITAPMFIGYFAISICQQVGGECSQLSYLVPYLRQVALVHAVYGPLIYMIRSKEFASAVRKMLQPNYKSSVNYF